jgi:multidrug efflux pump
LQNSVVMSLLLVLLVVILAMDWRGAMLVGMTVPGSFLVAILMLYLLGYTTNVVVLFALILSVGILVDGAIVVGEYAQQLRRQGKSLIEAYVGAARGMMAPVASGTLVILIVFLPLLWWPDVVGQFMKFMPITLFFTLLASWAMAMFFLPALAIVIPEAKGGHQESLGDRLFDTLGHAYTSVVKKILVRPGMWIVASVLLLVLVVLMYGRLGPGVQFFPEIEPDRAQLEVHASGDLSLAAKDALVRQVEARLGTLEGVAVTSVKVGKTSQDQAEDIIGAINLEYVPWSPERPKSVEILATALARVGDLPGVKVVTAAERAGPQQGKPVQITLMGTDFTLLRAVGSQLAAELRKEPGLMNVDTNLPQPGVQWEMRVDRQEAGRAGTNLGEIGQMISLATEGAIIGKWRPGDRKEEVDIVARFAEPERTLSTLEGLQVPTANGQAAVADLVQQVATPKVTQIQRLDQKTQVTVEADVAPGFLADTMVKMVQQRLAQEPLPPGIEVRYRGDTKAQDNSQQFLQLAFIVGVLLIGLTLLIQFNSFGQVAILLSAVVLSVMGVLVGHLVMDKPFGIVMSGLGIISLAGIVVNHNIVLIDTYNHLKAGGMGWYQALLESGHQRLRPVVLTALTTAVGIIPLAFRVNVDFVNREITYNAPSTQWWDQLASSILFGLTFATFLTLLLTPCMLALLEKFNAWRHARKAATAQPAKRTR